MFLLMKEYLEIQLEGVTKSFKGVKDLKKMDKKGLKNFTITWLTLGRRLLTV